MRTTFKTPPLPIVKSQVLVMKPTTRVRFRCRRPVPDVLQKTLMFLTLIPQYLNKLRESKVGGFTTPQPFHAIKVQGFNGNRIKSPTKICCQLPMKVFALVRDVPIAPCEVPNTPPPVARTLNFTRKVFADLTKFAQGLFQGLWCCIFSPVLSVKYASFIPKSAPTL